MTGNNQRKAWGISLGVVLAAWALSAQVVINEVMAHNRSAVAHGGVYPDYLELYNAGSTAVDIGGMSVDDGGTPPTKQYFLPVGTIIKAHDYLVVWCSTNVAVTGLRAPFGLSSDGETVRFRNADGVILDEVKFGLQAVDYPMGRVPDGAANWTLNTPTPLDSNAAQPLGSPDTLTINEWLADPLPTFDDYLEVFNLGALPVQLSGLFLTDDTSPYFINRAIPDRSFIAGRGFARFFADDLGGGTKNGAEHLDFKLSSNGETVTLYAANRATILSRVTFGPQVEDHSEGRLPDGGAQIVRFPPAYKTPGEANYADFKGVVISEALTHTDPPFEDAIELHNPGSNAVDISYWWLSDSGNNPQKFSIPPGTVIPAGGYVVFYEYMFGSPYYATVPFQLDSVDGETIYLSAGNSSGALTGEQTSFKAGPALNRVSFGRYQTSLGVDYPPMSHPTFGVENPINLDHFRSGGGQSNAYPRVGPVVISEIMFAPPDGDEEYVEIHNISSTNAPMYHQDYPTNRWRIRNGVEFDFPANLVLAANATLVVVGFDPVAEPLREAAFRQKHNVPAGTLILGPLVGKLSDAGEILHLQEPDKPEPWDSPKPGFVPYCQVELIKYTGSTPWPADALNNGKAIHRLSLGSYANDPTNWVAAAPSPGRPAIAPADADNDGLPDEWENIYNLNPSSALDADDDPDGDGLSNLQEFIAGTHPRQTASVLRMTRMQRTGSALMITFQAEANKLYALERSSQFVGGDWQTITNLALAAAPSERQIWLPFTGDLSGCFRLSVSAP